MEAALASAKASSVLSQAHLTKAGQDFKQSQELYAKKLVSDADFISAQTNLDVAKADYDSSQAQIRRSEGSLTQARDWAQAVGGVVCMAGSLYLVGEVLEQLGHGQQELGW